MKGGRERGMVRGREVGVEKEARREEREPRRSRNGATITEEGG